MSKVMLHLSYILFRYVSFSRNRVSGVAGGEGQMLRARAMGRISTFLQ